MAKAALNMMVSEREGRDATRRKVFDDSRARAGGGVLLTNFVYRSMYAVSYGLRRRLCPRRQYFEGIITCRDMVDATYSSLSASYALFNENIYLHILLQVVEPINHSQEQ